MLTSPNRYDLRSMQERIGPFTIEREIGRGGMGVVYLAFDTRLDRTVAVKALPEELANDPARLERFEREAKTLAQLNHPNIVGIYGVEEQGHQRYLVLEYVEGATLADRLDRGPIPIDEALDLAAQIASGIEIAHEAGVIHRDLKPGNVIVTPDGRAKVLDFGLARTEQAAPSSSSVGCSNSPTMTSPERQHSPTIEGAILGTAAYMSPEQARGRRIDKRTDIWSFGVLLYEMVAGVSPFRGETATDSIGAVLHKELNLEALPEETPLRVKRVLSRCLQRDKEKRFRDIGDVRLELLEDDADLAAKVPPAQPRSWYLQFLVAILLLALVAFAASLMMRRAPDQTKALFVTLASPAGARVLFSGDLAGPPVVSPDGNMIVFAAMRHGGTRQLWLRQLDEPEARVLFGTEGALFPFWSPDSREVAYFTESAMHRFDLASGTAVKVVDVQQARGGCWIDDGTIIYSPTFRSSLWMIDANGGTPEQLTTLDEERHTSHRWPSAISGTNRFLFTAVTATVGKEENNGIYLGTLDSDAPPVRLLPSDYSAACIDGWLLNVRDGVLLATRLDLESASLSGRPVVLAKGIAADLSTWHGQFSASAAGVLTYYQPFSASEVLNRIESYSWSAEGDQVSYYDYDGRLATIYARNTPMFSMSLSPDGSMLAMDVISPDGYSDIWIHPTAWVDDTDTPSYGEIVKDAIMQPKPRRLTFLPGPEYVPQWSPDGTEIVFRWDGDENNPRGIYRKRIGGGSETLVHDNGDEDDHPSDWTPDGRYLIVTTDTILPSDENDLIAVPLDGGEATPLVTDPGTQREGQVSPNGKWLAYTDSLNNSVIYVIPFAPAWPEGRRHDKWLVSENGGRSARWSREGDQLFYISTAGTLIALDVDTSGETFSFSSPRALFQAPWDIGRTYDPTPRSSTRGIGFMFVDSDTPEDTPITMILHWQRLLDGQAK